MLTLVLTRHGLTDRSEPEQHLGQHIDISLSAAGRRQAEALARRLAGVRFDRVISSPLFRAQETAEILARGAGRSRRTRGSRRWTTAAWEGLTYEQIEERDGAARREWELAPTAWRVPAASPARTSRGGSARSSRTSSPSTRHGTPGPRSGPRPPLGGPGGAPGERPVLAVAHSSTNRVLMCVALGTDLRDYRKRFVQAQANLTVLRWEAGDGPEDAKLLVANDLGHLRAASELPWG